MWGDDPNKNEGKKQEEKAIKRAIIIIPTFVQGPPTLHGLKNIGSSSSSSAMQSGKDDIQLRPSAATRMVYS